MKGAVSEECPLYEKGNKYFADWRDRKGLRHRKSFSSPEEAQAYELEQKERAHPKGNSKGQRSPKLLHRGSERRPQKQREVWQSSSSRLPVESRSDHSQSVTSRPSTCGSQSLGVHPPDTCDALPLASYSAISQPTTGRRIRSLMPFSKRRLLNRAMSQRQTPKERPF